ncbi:MAG: hypothetical protein ACREBO_11495 [Novosphingobium sp.]
MRTSSLAASLLLFGCSAAEAPTQAAGEEHIACALAGAKDFAPNCAVERAEVDGGRVLVVRHPDGGFRRFAVTDDGRGVAPADGAQAAAMALSGNVLEVTVDGDRYRFPVTVKGDAAAR